MAQFPLPTRDNFFVLRRISNEAVFPQNFMITIFILYPGIYRLTTLDIILAIHDL